MATELEPRIEKLEMDVRELREAVTATEQAMMAYDERMSKLVTDHHQFDEALFGNAKLHRKGLIEFVAELQTIVIENQKLIATNPDMSRRISEIKSKLSEIEQTLNDEDLIEQAIKEEKERKWDFAKKVGLGLGTIFIIVEFIRFLITTFGQ